jgi:OOP family OmpA-OmpF porin
MNIKRGLTVCACVLSLSAGGFRDLDEVEALNSAQAVGSPFTQKLTSEYKNFVNGEVDSMNDYADGLHFARKGLASARGDVVLPEPVSDWNLLPGHVQELSAGRARLINVFDLGARELQPDLSAVAQARFDCWVEQQEENFQPDDIAACKNEFMEALSQLEGAMPPAAPAAAEPAPAEGAFDVNPAEPMKVENAMYLVFFDFDQSTLGPGAQSVLDSVAQEAASRSIKSLNVVGHADTSGPEEYNRQLAMRRANAVRDALVQRGIDPNSIRVDSRGENELLVQTADNVREPANRRAQISFE